MLKTVGQIAELSYLCVDEADLTVLQDYIYDNVRSYTKYQITAMFNCLQARKNFLIKNRKKKYG